MISRTIQQEIEKWLFKKKVIVIYGARQVGKTTLVKAIMQSRKERSLYLNCDEPDIRDALSNKTSLNLKQYIGNYEIVIIDEAQRVSNIGLTLKLLIDNYPEIQVIATGSSSFDLSNHVKEPLTGRKIEFTLYPLSIDELISQESTLDFTRLLPNRLLYGSYPGIITNDPKEVLLREITETYLYRDLLEIQTVRNPELLRKLLQALALQIGSEVSYPELGMMLNLDKNTVARYINLLIQTNVLFELPPFKGNLRSTLGKLRKIYFCDLGIRNTLINNFNPIELRTDVGSLWENYIILERKKLLSNRMIHPNIYFWRAYNKAEIDYLEEKNGKIEAYEIKWNETRSHPPKAFFDTFQKVPYTLINQKNFLDFLT
jgi:hypothetical protein